MKRRVQLELNAPRVNWPMLQSQPLECVLSDGTYPPPHLPFSPFPSVLLHLFTHSSTHSNAFTWHIHKCRHGHACKHTPSLSLSLLLTLSLYLAIRSFILSFIQTVAHVASFSLTPPLSSILSLHTYLCRVLLLFSTSYPPSLPLSPSLFLPLSLIPVEEKSHHCSCSHCAKCAEWSAKCAAAGHAACTFLLHGFKQKIVRHDAAVASFELDSCGYHEPFWCQNLSRLSNSRDTVGP